MGSLVSGILGGGAGGSSAVQSAEQSLLGTETNNTVSQMNLQGSLDTLQTQAQETSQISNTANQIASAFEETAASKTQSQEAILHTDTQATASA